MQSVHAQTLETAVMEFRRDYFAKDRMETTEGTLFYESPGRVTLLVKEPILQWMVLEGTDIAIYYPNERRAFRIGGKGAMTLPFFELFLSVTRDSYGLPDLGYTMVHHEVRGDTLYSRWDPPKRGAKVLGQFVLGIEENRLVYAEVMRTDGTTLTRTRCRNHVQHGATHFPLEIISKTDVDADSTIERVQFFNPEFDVTLPEEVSDFEIPSDVMIEQIKW
jgi:hypothetical protein